MEVLRPTGRTGGEGLTLFAKNKARERQLDPYAAACSPHDIQCDAPSLTLHLYTCQETILTYESSHTADRPAVRLVFNFRGEVYPRPAVFRLEKQQETSRYLILMTLLGL